jgi:beta-galactosidase
MNVTLAPGATGEFTVPYECLPLGREAVLNVSFVQRSATAWADEGHEVAWEQFILSPRITGTITTPIRTDAQALRAAEDKDQLTIENDTIAVSFSRATGDIVSYRSNGAERLLEPVRPNFWRAPTDNDKGNRMPERCGVWRDAARNKRLAHLEWTFTEGCCNVTAVHLLATAPVSTVTICYTIHQDGQLEIDEQLVPGSGSLPEIPEIGMMFVLDGNLDTFSWYGLGPHDSYWDRKTSARLGRYTGLVADQFVPYLRPQECGNKSDVRHASVTSSADSGGLRFDCPAVMEINALPWTPEQLEASDHPYKLPASAATVLRVNDRQMGVGGDDTWGAPIHPEYTLPANRTYRFKFTVTSI